MRKLLIIFIWTLFSCNNSKPIDKPKSFSHFDFSYNDVFSTCFSIKFTQSDSVFIKQHFAPVSSDTPKNGQSYYAILTEKEKQRLDSFINKINFSKLDTSYFESYHDGIEYQFYIDKDSTKKLIYVHSDSLPTDVKTFGFWIADLKKNLKLFKIDTVINFGSVRHFLPPRVPAPTIKFTPPKVE